MSLNLTNLGFSTTWSGKPQSAQETDDDTTDAKILSVDSQGRTIIHIDDIDFVTMHNLLYFLYTGHANLHYEKSNVKGDLGKNPEGYPPPADPFSLYRAANMYLVEELEARCYRFLTSTCTATNICERLLGNAQCEYYEKLKNFYFEFVIQNYDVVKMTDEWTDTYLKWKDCSPDLQEYKARILLQITKLISGVKGICNYFAFGLI